MSTIPVTERHRKLLQHIREAEKTWEPIDWPFGPLPFVLVNRDPDITEVIRVTREET